MSTSCAEQILTAEGQELPIRPNPSDGENDWLAEADALADQLKSVAAAHVEIRFAIGDWLNKYAHRDKVYDIGEEKFRKPRKQLVDFASTARRMPADSRKFKVSFNHYRVVANNAKNDKFTYWLERAQNFNVNCEDLRQQILTESDKTAKISVIISEEVYETLKSIADTNKSTVQELAGVWLQEKVKTELEIRSTERLPCITTLSPWILNKRAEAAEREREAQELYDAKFPTIPREEFKRHWTAFLSTVYTVREAEKSRREAERIKQAEAQAEKARQYEAGLQVCRELGLMTREETWMHERFENATEQNKNTLLEMAFESACRENNERAAVKVAETGSVSVIS
jgi:hypothetical protein